MGSPLKNTVQFYDKDAKSPQQHWFLIVEQFDSNGEETVDQVESSHPLHMIGFFNDEDNEMRLNYNHL